MVRGDEVEIDVREGLQQRPRAEARGDAGGASGSPVSTS